MAKRISPKNVGQLFNLHFDSYSTPYDLYDVKLLRVEGEGKKQHAVFLDKEVGEWEAYRDEYTGRWCYGSSAQRLSVLDD